MTENLDNVSEKRHLATVQVIKSLETIHGADRILLATVLGWHAIVRLGEFSVGQKVVFFEPDSLIPCPPQPWNEFLWSSKDKDVTKPVRIRTMKMKKCVSQGLVVAISAIPALSPDTEVGTDVGDILGVTKWEMPIAANMRGLVKGAFPFFLKKTDTERIQAYPDIIQEFKGRDVYGTLKIDGTSGTFYFREGEFGVCSRNLDLKESDNVYWQMARKYTLPEKMAKLGGHYALQGEVAGMSIQGNKLGLPDVQLFGFDVFDIAAGKYLGYQDSRFIMIALGVTPVTTVFQGKWQWETSDDLIAYANGQDYANKTPAEGVVFRPMEEAYSQTLDSRMAIKAISPRFLLKYGE